MVKRCDSIQKITRKVDVPPPYTLPSPVPKYVDEDHDYVMSIVCLYFIGQLYEYIHTYIRFGFAIPSNIQATVMWSIRTYYLQACVLWIISA